MLATYMQHMCDNNLEIGIAGSSCPPQLIKLIAWSLPQFPTPMEVDKIDCLRNIFIGFYEIQLNLHVRLPLLGDHLLKQPPIQNIKSIPVKSLQLDPLVTDHLSQLTVTTFLGGGYRISTVLILCKGPLKLSHGLIST